MMLKKENIKMYFPLVCFQAAVSLQMKKEAKINYKHKKIRRKA